MVHGDPTWKHPILVSSVASMALASMAEILGIGKGEDDGVAALNKPLIEMLHWCIFGLRPSLAVPL